jgi:hypothetical protein
MCEYAIERAEQSRPTFDELSGLSAREIAAELNERNIATPTGGVLARREGYSCSKAASVCVWFLQLEIWFAGPLWCR